MRFPILPTLSIVSSALAISLNDISPLPSNSVTPGCESAYNEQLSACPSDLDASKECSPECSGALDEVAKKVILACRQAYIDPISLLRTVVDGGIQNELCGVPTSAPAETTTAATTAPPTSISSPSATKTFPPSGKSIAPSFSGALTFTTVERHADALTLDSSPAPTGSFATDDTSYGRLLYDASSTSHVATATAAAVSSESGSGRPLPTGQVNSASSSPSVQRGAWAAFALLIVFLSL